MKRILIVEDNEDNMYLIGFIVRKNGHEVIEARSGQEGVDMALKEKPDMILMDIQLPDFDGLETTRRIRNSGAVDVPIIALTSYAMAGDKQRAIKAGCNGYIEKPINPDTIMGEIEKFFNN